MSVAHTLMDDPACIHLQAVSEGLLTYGVMLAGSEGAVDNSDRLPASLLQCGRPAHVGLLHVLLRGSAAVWYHPAPGCHHKPCQLFQLW